MITFTVALNLRLQCGPDARYRGTGKSFWLQDYLSMFGGFAGQPGSSLHLRSFYRPLWLFSGVVNSLYPYYWDVTRDWDLSCFTRIFKFSRPSLLSSLLYGQKWYTYPWEVTCILRCTWTYKLSAHLHHNYLTVFTIVALKIFRRFQWAFFRVENEWNKTNSMSSIQLSQTETGNEEEKLLADNEHHNA